jgi:hypothetical protein
MIARKRPGSPQAAGGKTDSSTAPVKRTMSNMSRCGRKLRRVWLLLAVAVVVAGCATTVASPMARPTSTPAAHRRAPSGVPAAVFARALQVLEQPHSRVDQPVQWVQTTYGAFERPAHLDQPGTGKVPVYVIQMHGYFPFSGSPQEPYAYQATPGGPVVTSSPGPPPTAVAVLVIPVGRPVDGVYGGGMSTDTEINLGAMGTVHTFHI